MSYLDDPDAQMTSVHVRAGEVLVLIIDHIDEFARRCFSIFEALLDCAAFVNWRRVDRAEPPVLALAYYKTASLVEGSG